MSATSTSTDPVQTVIDLLTGTPADEWTGDKPDPIERQWAHDFNWKQNQNGPSAYVWSPEVGTQDQLSADGTVKDQTETIGVDVWAPTPTPAYGGVYGATYGSADVAVTVADDVVAILEDYWNDRTANTRWHRIRPQSVDDRRAEAIARRADKHVISVQVQLRRETSIGT